MNIKKNMLKEAREKMTTQDHTPSTTDQEIRLAGGFDQELNMGSEQNDIGYPKIKAQEIPPEIKMVQEGLQIGQN